MGQRTYANRADHHANDSARNAQAPAPGRTTLQNEPGQAHTEHSQRAAAEELIASSPAAWMPTFLGQIQAAIDRAGSRSIVVSLALEGPPPAAARTFRILSDELPALRSTAMRRSAERAPGAADLGSDIASARAFIAVATRGAAEAYLQQIRAARQLAHGTSRVVHLELEGPIPAQPRSFAVRSDDLDDLEIAARDRMHALRDERTSESYQRFPEPGAARSGGPLPAELYVAGRAIDPARPVEIPESDRADIDRIADAIQHELGAWRAFRAQLHGTPPGRAAFEAVARLSGGIDDLTAGLYLARRLGTDAGHLVREMVGFSSHPGAVRLQTMLGFHYAHAIPAGHRYTISIQGFTLRGGRDGAAANFSVRGGTLTYTNDFGMRYVQPIRATNVSLSLGLTARQVWDWFHGSGGWSGGEETEMSSTDATVTDYAWFVPGEDFHGTFRLFQISGGMSVGALGASENDSGSSGVLEVGLAHGPMAFVVSGTNHSASFSRGRDTPGRFDGNDIGVGAEAGIGRISTTGAQTTDRPVPPPNGGGDLEERGMQQLLTTVVYFGLRDAQVPSGGNEALAEAIAAVDRFLIDFPGSRTSLTITGYASPRWRAHANDPTAASVANYQLSMQRVHAVETQLRVALLQRATGGACQVSSSVCDPPPLQPEEESGLGSQPALEGGVELTDASAVWHRVVIDVRGSVYRHASVTPNGQAPAQAQAGHP